VLLDRLGNRRVLAAELGPKNVQVRLLPRKRVGKLGHLLNHFSGWLRRGSAVVGRHSHLLYSPVRGSSFLDFGAEMNFNNTCAT
jgi:hypothetical protein